ncbi:uncharacterized protein LTR77_003956 [Saxophila tyrrhenica]|uniref:Mitochondrial integral membrane protein n=1 Tax=Saxophila tyrrhenica TaxID=1690608 RepID=A0AAV9PHS6_9PEZI|nr:hypothetical protein LTR77_003956 [Saxophila tyrrhenica]
MTLWGSNNKDHDEQPNGDDTNMARSSEDRPTERDRLLPEQNNRRSDGYLDPDDPAVSPYNLFAVRAARGFTVLVLAISFIWWVLLFVSIFISPPGLHTRGSGFTDFAFTTLTTGLLLLSLLFFSAPSLAMRVCQSTIAVLLLVDLIIIVAVPRIRAEEGPPGIASVTWTTLMAGWCVFTDRLVAWGKKEEEERLTGRPETRRTLKQWLAVLAATIFLVIYIIITILITATLVLRSRDASLQPEGQRYSVDDGKYKVHLACIGDSPSSSNKNSSTPTATILLESAEMPLEYDLEHWAYAAWNNGTIDRYCYWDRPGYAWSDNAPSPHSAGMSADNLADALAQAGEQGPFILVSAGYGSIVSRIFSSRNYKKVSGIMLIDPLPESHLSQIGSPTRGFLLWAYGIISPLGIRRILGALFAGRTREDRVYGVDADQTGKLLKAKLQENLVAQSLTKSEISTSRSIQTPDTPLVVVSSGIETGRSEDWGRGQKEATGITENLVSWDVVNKAPHFVWETLAGRTVMEKRLGQLVKAAAKMPTLHVGES